MQRIKTLCIKCFKEYYKEMNSGNLCEECKAKESKERS